MTLSKWQKRTLRILGSVAIVISLFYFIPFHEVIEAFRHLRLEYALAGLLMNTASGYLEGFQLYVLLRRAKVPTTLWEVLETKMTTRFYGQFLPSELMAASVKFYRLAQPTQQWGEVMAALVFFRVINMGALTLFGLVFWLIEMPTGPARWIGVILIGMTLMFAAIHLFLSSRRVARSAKRLLQTRWFAWFKGRFVDKAKKLANTTMASYRLFHASALLTIALSIVRHSIGIASFWFTARALGVELSILTIGWIRVVLHLIMSLPISLSGIGVREGSLVLLLRNYGVSGADAVALAFLLFVMTLIQNASGGVIEIKNLLRPKPKAGDPAESGAQ